MTLLKNILVLALSIVLFSCGRHYESDSPTINRMEQVVKNFDFRVNYYSPSVLRAMSQIDSSDALMGFTDYIHEAYTFNISKSSRDTLFGNDYDKALANIDSVSFPENWTTMFNYNTPAFKVKVATFPGKTEVEKLELTLVQGDKIQCFYVEGHDLEKPLSQLIAKTVFSSGLGNFKLF